MKYLVNRETKEHRIAGNDWADSPTYNVVEADAEGWIKWDGGECPLPDGVACDIKYADGDIDTGIKFPPMMCWRKIGSGEDIIAYRLILDKPAVKESLTTDVDDLLSSLKSAHEAAQKIPDLEAKLRETLGKMGYDLVTRSPFVERSDYESEVVESESPVETPKEDMTDWRNWREGDLVTWEIGDTEYPWWTPGKLYEVKLSNKNLVVFADDDEAYHISGDRLSGGARFRFHSRPEAS